MRERKAEHIGAARGQPFQHREAGAETEAGGGVLGVIARGAAVDQQSAQRHHEWLDMHFGGEQAVHGADHQSAGEDHGKGDHPVDVVIDDQVDEQHAQQRYHRADR